MVERLPTVRESSVQQSGTTTPYYSVRANPDAFGAGIGRALQQLGGTIGQLGQIEAQIADQARAAEGFKIEAQVKDQIRQRAYDPKDGWFAQRGGKALNVTETARQGMQEIFQASLEGVEDPKLRAALEKSYTGTQGQVLDTTARHEFGELQTHAAEGFKAQTESAIADAFNGYNDPAAVADAIARAKGAIRGTADLAGLSPAQVELIEAETASSIHMAVLQRYAQENPEEAFRYYEQNRANLTGKDHVTAGQLITPALREYRARDAVQGVLGVPAAVTQIWSALEQQESGGQPDAVSPKGAMGVAQLMFPAAREAAQERGYRDVVAMSDAELKQVLLTDTDLNRELGQHYLAKQLKRFNGDMELALIAYNAGPSHAQAFVANGRDRSGLPEETRNYVNSLLGNYQDGQTEAPPGVYSTPPGQRMTRETATGKLQNFSFEVLAGSGGWVDEQAALGLDRAASAFKAATGKDMTVNSGTRSRERNRQVGGASNSVHMAGAAFDLSIRGLSEPEQMALVTELRKQGFNGFGIYKGHLHADMRANPARWATGVAMPKWLSQMLDQDQPAAPGPTGEAPTQSRTIRGQTPTVPASPVNVPVIGTDWAAAERKLNEIVDPGERSRALQLLGLEKAQQDGAANAAKEGAKQALWDYALQGGNAADFATAQPDAARLLGPSDFNSVFTYQKNLAEGKVDTDQAAYTELQFMTPQELARINPLDYRNQLNESDYKEVVKLVRDARGSLQGDPEAVARFTESSVATNILKDTLQSAGLPVGGRMSSAQTKSLADFNQRYRSALQQAYAANGNQPLTPDKIQKLADQVMISRFNQGWTGPAFAEETQQVSSWETVPQEAATHLTRTYEQLFQKLPDDGEALELYQSALEIWDGRTPVEEDPYWDDFTKFYTTQRGVVPPEVMRDAYVQWITGFLPVR